MPSQTFKTVRHLMRRGPEILKFSMEHPVGYLYTVFFKDGTVKMGASVRPALRISEQFLGQPGIEKITLSEKFENYREVELKLVKEFQIFLPNGWNGSGSRETWKLPESVISEVLKCYETGFSPESLNRIFDLCDAEYENLMEVAGAQ